MAAAGTVAVYEELAELLNHDPEWQAVGKKLNCSVIHVYTAPVDKAFFLRFEDGRMCDVHEVSDIAQEDADFVLTSDPNVWQRVHAKVPKARASGFHLALSTGQIRFTGPFMRNYQQNRVAWEHLLDVMSANKLAAG